MIKLQICPVCGSKEFQSQSVLWQELIDDWELSSQEVNYINRQQGFGCISCGNNLRSMALAKAITNAYQFFGSLVDFVQTEFAKKLRVLEINEAGNLTATLAMLPNYKLVKYPEHDMTDLTIKDASFDLVIHSDTLEHVPDPVKGLLECKRVLASNGRCIFTVPIVVGRVSRSRNGMKDSFHGNPINEGSDFIVHTEFGADVWTYLTHAGFSAINFHILEYPAGIALEAFEYE